jgi:hypothetical protein
MKFLTDIENEIDVIRDRIYDEIKDMPSSERTAYINSRAEAVMKQFNIRFVKSAVENTPEVIQHSP